MEVLIGILEEVVRFFTILEELYHAWKMSPHLYVIMMGRVIFTVVIMMVIVAMWEILKKMIEGRSY